MNQQREGPPNGSAAISDAAVQLLREAHRRRLGDSPAIGSKAVNAAIRERAGAERYRRRQRDARRGKEGGTAHRVPEPDLPPSERDG